MACEKYKELVSELAKDNEAEIPEELLSHSGQCEMCAEDVKKLQQDHQMHLFLLKQSDLIRQYHQYNSVKKKPAELEVVKNEILKQALPAKKGKILQFRKWVPAAVAAVAVFAVMFMPEYGILNQDQAEQTVMVDDQATKRSGNTNGSQQSGETAAEAKTDDAEKTAGNALNKGKEESTGTTVVAKATEESLHAAVETDAIKTEESMGFDDIAETESAEAVPNLEKRTLGPLKKNAHTTQSNEQKEEIEDLLKKLSRVETEEEKTGIQKQLEELLKKTGTPEQKAEYQKLTGKKIP